MSAFIVNKEHIDALITFMVEKRVSYWNEATRERVNVTRFNATETGQILWDENFRSVNYRYHEDEKPEVYRFTYRLDRVPPVQIIKAVHCLDYQSCETDDWETTLAHRVLDAILSAACRSLPGYEEAYWGIKAPSAKPTVIKPDMVICLGEARR
jgi:hypothetical protein